MIAGAFDLCYDHLNRYFAKTLNLVVLSVAKDPRNVDYGSSTSSFLGGTQSGKKAGKSATWERVWGFFAALRMTNLKQENRIP